MHRQYFVIKLSVFSVRDVREKPNRQIPNTGYNTVHKTAGFMRYCEKYITQYLVQNIVFWTLFSQRRRVVPPKTICTSRYLLGTLEITSKTRGENLRQKTR